ncbi:MAG: hypothetical protein GWN01_02265, partial [Nitrosopumilaceae archaeon]|nr:hypothetical protein [Nitrosopumilaceae archaeon]NIU86132.1 hypothetical protein [Nitrosopumilaceae archaeon]NIV64937.1 hypothetical protein [Nitrosopumilaceae archaeon]NIX60399.1 hypothetical protein [Nitrosopumilaceae archaeon]
MSKNNKKEETPWFVSYPRSGCIWIQAMMEIALDSPRGPNQTGGITWRPPQPGEEFLWNHTHDINLNIKPSETEVGDIFLYR